MATLPARFVKCECGKLVLINALSLPKPDCPTCGKPLDY